MPSNSFRSPLDVPRMEPEKNRKRLVYRERGALIQKIRPVDAKYVKYLGGLAPELGLSHPRKIRMRLGDLNRTNEHPAACDIYVIVKTHRINVHDVNIRESTN